ncbi:aminotransferase class V-fold PLP-dependent enzyme [Oscillospiraceae bacterium 38-13]
MIYLDNGATTFPKPDCVYNAMDRFARTGAVNAGRGAYRAAREAGKMVEETRELLISLLDAREQAEAVFAPSATVMLNQIILGQNWTADSVAYVSPYEHNSVLRPLEEMRKRFGFSVRQLPLRGDGGIDLDAVEARFAGEPPSFVAVSAVSNVTGYILPAEEIFRLAKRYKAFTLLDGSQAVGLIPLRFGRLRADAVTFAGHKTLYGPFGIAGCLIRNKAELNVVLSGGTGSRSTSLETPRRMPGRLECGSKDTVAIQGLNAALKWLRTVNPLERERELTDYLLASLRDIPGIHLYTAPSPERQAGVVSLNLDGFQCGEAAAILDSRRDIAVRAGHHCAALIHERLGNRDFRGTVRVSLGYFNRRSDIDALAEALRTMDRKQLENVNPDSLRGLC